MAGNSYCQLADVQARLYAGQGLNPGDPAPDDPTRDALLKQLIAETSRDFDQEVFEGSDLMVGGAFAPVYEARLYSGAGDQSLKTTPFAFLSKVEIDATPGQLSHTWQDYTVEFSQNKMGTKPIRGWPKNELFRQSSFYQDPFRLGNVRLTGVWGVVLPDPAASQPTAPWYGLNAAAIQALAPDPTLTTGWWVTPDDVVGAVITWVVHRFQMSKTGYGTDSNTGVASYKVDKSIPGDTQRVITRYRGENKVPKFALVANDGSDVESYPTYRWAGWQTTN